MFSFAHIAVDGSKAKEAEPNLKDLPIIPTRNLVLFPGVTIPLSLGRQTSIEVAREAAEKHIPVGIVCQKNPDDEFPELQDLYGYGVIADVLNVFKLPDDSYTALLSARGKMRITGKGEGATIPASRLSAMVKAVRDVKPRAKDFDFITVLETIDETARKILAQQTNDALSEAMKQGSGLDCHENPELFVNFLATNLPIPVETKMEMLAENHLLSRAYSLATALFKETEKMVLVNTIRERARESMTENQRTAFMQHQMEELRREIYGDSDDADNLEERANSTAFTEGARKIFNRELDKLRRLAPQSPDYAVQYTYLDTMLQLPWNNPTPVNNDFLQAERQLDEDHYGLEKVKERILEQLAVMIHNPEGKSPIICLVGAPGVGKTSLGRSVAAALGRKYERVSLGGVHDESEIRGHRRTYLGSMPGRIIEAMRRAGTSNPVLLLDEVDKMGQDYKGDPSAALLEVLDPEQNSHFHDNYIDVDYDLSDVLFIATANTLSTLQQPLLDRMEIIEIPGYLREEKVEIAVRHLLPKVCKELNVKRSEMTISREAIEAIIDKYTSESGVRQLEKTISSVMRKLITRRLSGKKYPKKVMPSHLSELLGVEKFQRDKYEGNEFAGLVTGLAWTQVGGEILAVESSLSAGKGDRVTLTGNLGDVMKESATIALQWVKSHASLLGIDPGLFERYNLHIHFPEGAVPKDGPSAGITMVTSIVSTFRQKRVKSAIAMTGEMTLRGKVLPVGGIKEKILAARRVGINEIILSKDNRKDIEEIPARYIDGMTFHYVTSAMEVIELAITDEDAVDAVTL
ncbi:MAG: endopeptidase La [Muribaculaceae bacterium]|nr:endopeptidase La [Muribaculaceae bacterium]